MPMLFNRDGSLVGYFEGEGELFSYILQEAARAADGEAVGDWRFTYSSPQQLEELVREMGNKSLVFMAHQACHQKQALVTVATGDGHNPSFMIVTPGRHVAALRREWCKKYCASHGLRIVVG